ncbi:hypothetical protein AHAS_Ahas11G0128600 [Arachis hypogaea]
MLGLACHAFDTKWHAIVEVLLGMVIVDGSGVPRSFCVLHCCSLELCTSVPRQGRPHACLDFFSGL